jgi:hypothetical protein
MPPNVRRALARRVVDAYTSLADKSAALASALFTLHHVIVDRAGVVRLKWDWTVGLPAAPPARKREDFWFGRTDPAGVSGHDRLAALRSIVEELLGSSENRLPAVEQSADVTAMADALREARDDRTSDQDLARTVVECFHEHRELPPWVNDDPAPVTPPPDRAQSRFRMETCVEVQCHAAWPLANGRVLAWGTDRVLAIYDRRDGSLLWRDSEPIHMRCSAQGPDGRLAVGGWEGDISWFAGGAQQGRVSAGWTIGALADHHGSWLAGSWNGRLFLLGERGVTELLKVEDGIYRIAVGSTASAVLGLHGSISEYLPDGTRRRQLNPVEDASDIAFANGVLAVLTDDGRLRTANGSGGFGRPDRLPARGVVRLLVRPADRRCLLMNNLGHSWLIDRDGTYPREAPLPIGGTSLSTAADLRRCTTVADHGGVTYWRDGGHVKYWPEATTAAVSWDGRTVAVTLPDTIELWNDEEA